MSDYAAAQTVGCGFGGDHDWVRSKTGCLVCELRAENKRFRDALERVADYGFPGYSEAGCACCISLDAINDEGFGTYTVTMAEAGEHLVACPVGTALLALPRQSDGRPEKA